MKNKSYAVTADVEVPEGGANGVIVAQGGRSAVGRSTCTRGVPTHCYNLLGLNSSEGRRHRAAPRRVPPGPGGVRLRRRRVWPRAATPPCSSTGQQVGTARQEASIPMFSPATRPSTSGVDNGTSVSDDYTPDTSRFTGTVNWVQLDQGIDDQSHLISPRTACRWRWRSSSRRAFSALGEPVAVDR